MSFVFPIVLGVNVGAAVGVIVIAVGMVLLGRPVSGGRTSAGTGLK